MSRKRLLFRYAFAVLWTLLVVVVGLSVNVYLALRPATLEARVRVELSRVLDAPFSFSSLELSWSRGVQLQDFRLGGGGAAGESGAVDLLRAASLRVRPAFLSLLRGRFEIDSVMLDEPSFRLSRDADGTWNLQKAFCVGGSGMSSLWTGLRRLPTVIIRDGRVEYTDSRFAGDGLSGSLDDLQATLETQADGTTRIRAEMHGKAGTLYVRGECSLLRQDPVVRWSISARTLDISRLVEWLPERVARELRRWRPEGYVDFSCDLKWDPGSQWELLALYGELRRCLLRPPCFPGPLKKLTAKFRAGETTLQLEDLAGEAVGGTLHASGRIESAVPWLEAGFDPEEMHWGLEASLESLRVTPSLRDFIPHPLTVIHDGLIPGGRFGVDIRIPKCRGFRLRSEDVLATLRLEGLDFAHHQFPYRLRNLRGEVSVENGRVVFNRPLEGRDGDLRVTISGRGVELHPDGELDVVIKATSVPLDEQLRRALPPVGLEIWDDFRIRGLGDAVIHVHRDARQIGAATPTAGGVVRPRKPGVKVMAALRDVGIRYRDFPYPIQGITGTFQLDLETDTASLTDLAGRHGDQVIVADAVVRFGDEPLLKVLIHCDDLSMNPALLAALPDEARELVRDFGFDGRFKTDVAISRMGEPPTRVTTELELLEGGIRHKAFPYPLRLAEGHFKVSGGRAIEWTGLSTPPGDRPYLVSGGILTTGEELRTFSFSMDVAGLEFDDTFQEALPRELQAVVGDMGFGGTYGGHVDGVYEFSTDDPESYTVQYHASDVSVKDGSLDFGLELRELQAGGWFTGFKRHDEPTVLDGVVQVDSCWFNRLHLTDGKVRFAFGKALDALPKEGEATVAGRDYSPPEFLLERLRPEKARETFQMLIESDDVYGGSVDGILYVGTGDSNDIGGDFVGKGLKVSKSAEDVFGSRGARSSGSADGQIWFRGRNGDHRSLKGEGKGSITEARLAEVPLFLGILNLLFGDASSGQYFSEVLLKFGIADGKFVAGGDGVEIKSSAVKLVGEGTLDFSGNLDLNLEPHILNLEIPLVDQILTLLKKGLAQVWITGRLSEPVVEFVTGAGILRIDIGSGKADEVEPLPSDLREEARSGSGSPP